MWTGWMDIDTALNEMDVLRRRMDRLFHQAEAGATDRWASPLRSWPRVNLIDVGDALNLVCEVPGVGKDDFELSLSQDVLTLKGQRRISLPEGATVHRRERSPGTFSRSFKLPVKVDPDQADAKLEGGLLTITLPKLPELKPRTIAVTAG